jgi:hypothetical protein
MMMVDADMMQAVLEPPALNCGLGCVLASQACGVGASWLRDPGASHPSGSAMLKKAREKVYSKLGMRMT